jgi:anhydro-N-acetylmuramic acid kinase
MKKHPLGGKKMTYVMGMNSGSSFDGIDAVLAKIEMGSDGHPTKPQFVEGLTYEWPEEVKVLVLKAFSNELTIFELTRLNYVAGAVYAEAALALMKKCSLKPEEVDVIGVDGQTIYQEPPLYDRMHEINESTGLVERWLNGPFPCGMQIGESAIISAYTNITTVTHFRPADHALGGTGAPLMQYLDFVAFRNEKGPVLTLNIGGISNCQLADRDQTKMMAFDTGPGNVMLDHAAKRLYNKPYDEDGKIAASGTANQEMLAELMDHPFFKRKPPRSAWRLDFGADYADQIMDSYSHLRAEDMMATFSDFTAYAIANSIQDNIPSLDEMSVILASGGGVRNKHVMKSLAGKLPSNLRLTTSDEYGIPAAYKEAIKFATLAYATIHQCANNVPSCSGASGYTILGKISLAPRLIHS